MTDLIGTPLSILAAVILYIICTTLITRYAISGGKSTKEIIESNKLKAKKAKDFLNKYPEANIKSGRNFALAFGFIFAFASSIYAFSIIGERQNQIIFKPIDIDSAAVIQIQPPLFVKKVEMQKTEVPPPPPPPVIHPNPDIDLIDDKQEETDKPIISEPIPDDIIIDLPIIEDPTETTPFVIVEDMPRFKGCEGLSEEEANICTRTKFQSFLNKTPYPEEALRYDLEGVVSFSFVIDENGEIGEIEILRSTEKVFNKDVIKRLNKMPKFASPGMQRGKKVKVRYSTSINFQLN